MIQIVYSQLIEYLAHLNHAYAGYAGLVKIARELSEALHSPVWKQVRKPAPWNK